MPALPLTAPDALAALVAHDGDSAAAAAALGCSERTLYRRLKGHAVELARLRVVHGWPSQTSAATAASCASAARSRPERLATDPAETRRERSRAGMAAVRARRRLARLSAVGRVALAEQHGLDALASPALVTAWLREHPEHDLGAEESR